MIRYCVTIFLSAFLLFQIQPIIARLILPTFGGTAAVWTTCMMFFQVTLLLGYLYAHALRSKLTPKTAWLVHSMVILVAAILLQVLRPTAESAGVLQQTFGGDMTLSIVFVLTQTIGLPFLVLSTTGPLVQAWQSTSHSNKSPFRLYALSNLGSVLALASYPFFVEPLLSLSTQVQVWSVGFFAFALFAFWSGRQTTVHDTWNTAEATAQALEQTPDTKTSVGSYVFWITLSMTSSILLLATTNLLCQEVASIPFLWILPLTLYLLSFIICFDRPALYRRRLWMGLLAIASIASILLVHLDVHAGFTLQVVGLSSVCFFASMVCHGELEKSKPHRSQLTLFYLLLAVGGAAGGIFVSIVAPRIFNGFYEFHFGLAIALAVSLLVLYRMLKTNSATDSDPKAAPSLFPWSFDRLLTIGTGVTSFFAAAIVACSLLYFLDPTYHKGLVFQGRNDYGLTSVVDSDGFRKFINGRVVHGSQSLDPTAEMAHSSYYGEGSGVGVAFEALRSEVDRPLKIGVLGLGAGAMTTWFETGDHARFYEINPMVVDVATRYFSFLERCPAQTSVVVGDGRIQLAKDLKLNGSNRFDILIMDAFASDSVPVHLLTEECFELYNQHLANDGILLVHISNHFIDLLPVVLQHKVATGMTPVFIDHQSTNKLNSSQWILLTRHKSLLNSTAVVNASTPIPDLAPVRWTDDYSSVAAQLKWSAELDVESVLELRSASQFKQGKHEN